MRVLEVRVVLVLGVFGRLLAGCDCSQETAKMQDLVNTVKRWGERLGNKLQNLGDSVTRRSKVVDSFKHTKIILENGSRITEEIADKLRVMMANKEEAVKRIVEKAEKLSLHRKLPDLFTNSTYDYYNTDMITNTTTDPTIERKLKEDILQREEYFRCEELLISLKTGENLTKAQRSFLQSCPDVPYIEHEPDYFNHLPLVYHSHFEVPVNLNFSVMRIATSIYDREEPVLNDIRWSDALDLVFRDNFRKDPTLMWQYFAGTTGFLRHYPAIQWSDEKYDRTFDFRTRAWYLESISSPKDVIILLDMSGSMWQAKWLTAKFLVNNILDTLGDNDYVNVYLFNNDTHPLVDCFKYTLMQAHEENLRLLRESLNKHIPGSTGNMVPAFKLAFEILAHYRTLPGKAHCNQMIMLISEGIDYDYKPVELFGTQTRPESHYTPVRVFTFLIGTVPSDAVEMEWIACANMGYYVNISRSSEIAEKVLKYLTVLSRPLNFNFVRPEPIWTGTYVDLADRRLSNWLWNKHEGNQQRKIFMQYTKEAYEKYNCVFDTNDHFLLQTEHEYAKYLKKQDYNYMTTVSLPVFDKRPGQTAVSGVAGVDVPIHYIKTLTSPHRIGVNGYAFILTNNGLLLLHPDHRKEFHNIIKPTFNRVDITEVELMDDDNEPRDFNKTMLEMRENIVNQKTGYAKFDVKTHMDNMKRIILSHRHYFYTNIGPFSLVVAIPDKYGFYRMIYDIDKSYDLPPLSEHLTGLRNTKNWKIHPEWLYCRYFGEDRYNFENPEEELLSFLSNLNQPGWEWDKFCTPGLVNLLVMDAKVTEWYEDHADIQTKLKSSMNTFRVTVAFLATHTGLTRWKVGMGNETEPEFIKTNNKAIDEMWYKRAVEYNYNYSRSFIYSIPHYSDEYEHTNETLITASNAIFRVIGSKKAPIAVVGFQFEHSTLTSLFAEATRECGSPNCVHACDSQDLACFLLDNNAYVLIGEEPQHVGQFIGNINADVMHLLVEDNIYHQTRVFDYQGICYRDPPKPKSYSPASRKTSFYGNIFGVFNWIYTMAVYMVKSVFGAVTKDNPCLRAITSEYVKREVKKTLPTPCDQEMWLYTLKCRSFVSKNINKRSASTDCLWNYIVQPVSDSNLVLLVVNKKCPRRIKTYYRTPDPVELTYNLSMPCYIATKNNYTRRQYMTCINRHDDESKLNLINRKYCGITWN